MRSRISRKFRKVSPVAWVFSTGILAILVVLVILVVTDTVGVPAAIITAAIPVTLGLVGQFVTSDRQNKREIEAKLRERKSEVYEGFITFWMDTLALKENHQKLKDDPEQFSRGIHDFSKAMMLWASNDVIHAYSEFKRLSARQQIAEQVSPVSTLIVFERMLFLMREDLGHDPEGFRTCELLSFFVNDLDKYWDSVCKPKAS